MAIISYLIILPHKLQPANVTFKTLKGEHIRLHELRGSPVVISFWSTSCEICLKDTPLFKKLHSDYQATGLELIAVAMSYDPPNHVVELTEALKLPYTISLDIDSEIATAFGQVELTPTTFLLNPTGEVVYHHLGAMNYQEITNKIQSYL